ncbi:MAG: hypothetical protein AB1744_10630 [Candidatus Zixiibacteriota bacterium]
MPVQRSKGGFFIGVGCPGCGAELELEQNFFVLTCTHCGSPLRIIRPDAPPAYLVRSKLAHHEVRFHVDRYLRKHGLPLTGSGVAGKALYYPYWDVHALVLKKRNRLVERYVAGDGWDSTDDRSYRQERTEVFLAPYDVTVPAGYPVDGIPPSLGLRTGYLKAMPFASENIETDFDALPVLVPWTEMVENVKRKVRTIGSINQADFGRNRTDLLTLTGSVVYFPFHLLESYSAGQYYRLVVDGVTGRICSHAAFPQSPDERFEIDTPTIEFGQLTVEFHRCRNCGEDLPSEQSYVYICRNCREVTCLGQLPVEIEQIRAVMTDTEIPGDQLFPFWSLSLNEQVTSQGRRLSRSPHHTDRIVIPAFRITNFEAFYRLSKRISAAVSRFSLTTLDSPEHRLMPVSVSPSEAAALARAVVFRDEIGSNSYRGDTDLRVDQLDLFYAPFHPEHYFYVDSVLGAVTFEKSAVA